MKIVVASDHAGFALKEALKPFIESLGHEVEDKGAFTLDENDDYVPFIQAAAKAVSADPENVRGVVLGGSGMGEAMVSNRFKGVRCAVFYTPALPPGAADVEGRTSSDPLEILKLTREHNDANMLSLGARFLTRKQAQEAVEKFLKTPFSGAERHARRVRMIDE
jgi:ribose 5-phosphate isomerase B